MAKDRKEYMRSYMKSRRSVNNVASEDVNNLPTPKLSVNNLTHDDVNISPDIHDLLDKLTDPVWRDRLGRICDSLGRNRDAVWLGNFKLSLVSDLLAITSPR